jgi:hypothetical protein
VTFLLGFPLKLRNMRALGYCQGLFLTIKGLTMKKVLIAAAITAISTTAVADDYRFQVNADYLNDEISKNIDMTTYVVGGSFFLAPVDDSLGPKAEAAFLDHASGVHAGWGRTNIKIDDSDFNPKVDEDGDVWALGGRYITESGVILELDYATTEVDDLDSDALGVAIGYYLSDVSSITLGYLRTEVDDLDSDDDIWSLGYKHLFNNRFGLEADLTYVDAKYGENAYGITGALDYYINDNFSVGGVLGYVASDDDFTEAAIYGVNAEYYFNSHIALNAGYTVSAPDKGDDNEVWNVGIIGRF